MSRWISCDGKWFPALEKVSLVNHGPEKKHPKTGETIKTGEPYIYEGPDRGALFELWQIDKEGKVTYIGKDFKTDLDFLRMIKDQGFKNLKEYLDYVDYDGVKSKEEFDKKASMVTSHEITHRENPLEVIAGGADTSGGGADIVGGFGEARIKPATK